MTDELLHKIERLEAQVAALTDERIPRVDQASKRRDRRQVVSGFGLFAVAMLMAGTMGASALTGTNTVDSGDIKDGQVTTADIAANAVTATRIKNGELTGTDVKDGTLTGADLAAFPSARAEKSSGSQAAANISGVYVTFPTEVFDNAGMFDPEHPERLTAKKAGTYIATANLRWDVNDTGYRFAAIDVNQQLKLVAASMLPAGTYGGQGPRQNLSAVIRLNANDFVTVRTFQNSGGERSIVSSSAGETSIGLAWVGP